MESLGIYTRLRNPTYNAKLLTASTHKTFKMKYLTLILLSMIVLSCNKKTLNVSLKVHPEIFNEDTMFYLQVNIKNETLTPLYLEDLTNFSKYLKVFDSKGSNIKKEFDNYWYFDGRQSLNSGFPYLKELILASDSFIKSATIIDLCKIKKLNFFLKKDSVHYRAIEGSLIDKYKDVLLLEPGENVTHFLLMNSFFRTKKKAKIIFKYKIRPCIAVVPGYMHSYKHLDGRDDKFFILMTVHGINEVDGYKRFKGKIVSAPLVIN